MRFFDAQMRSEARSDDDLRNLGYFDTTHVVTTANPGRRNRTADELLDSLRTLVDNEPRRLERLGLAPHVALGVLPEARPSRTHHEIWRNLPALASRPEVVAIGEVGAWEDSKDHWEVFQQQVQIAKDLELPMIVTPPTGLRVNMTFKMMKRLEGLNVDPARIVFNHAEERTLEAILEEGYFATLTVGAYYLAPKAAAALIEAHQDSLSRMMLNSGLREGLADILGIPKTVVALSEAGAGIETIQRVSFETAMSFYRVTSEP